MAIEVKSEIGTLKMVLLKRPGRELEHLSPDTLSRLLFDDIPFLHGAQQEHDAFAQILREQGAEVVYLDELMTEVLESDPGLKEPFIDAVITAAGNGAAGYREALTDYLRSVMDARTLVDMTMAGITFCNVFDAHLGTLAGLVNRGNGFLMYPIPNLYFTRDPFACIGNGVALNHMYTATRNRETVYGSFILHHHPLFRGKVPFYYKPEYHFSIEGGDILNLSDTVLACGISQRTQPEAVEQLAGNLFADEAATVRTVLAFEIPRTRSCMHLDTVFTQVDRDKFTVHPGILETLRVYELTPAAKGGVRVREREESLEDILCEYLGQDRVTLIRCGGQSTIASEREQWNDGSNTLCLRPGVAVVYDRNYVTNRLLEENGITVLKVPSSELSRGRGGPRCMSMPLVRESMTSF